MELIKSLFIIGPVLSTGKFGCDQHFVGLGAILGLLKIVWDQILNIEYYGGRYSNLPRYRTIDTIAMFEDTAASA